MYIKEIDPTEMQARADEVAELMKVLSNRTRLMILCRLVEGEYSVSALADAVGANQSATSQQLALLRKDGLVRTRREGQTVYYALDRGDIQKLMRALYEIYCDD